MVLVVQIVIISAGVAIINAERSSDILCDPVGTWMIRERTNQRSSKRCICRPYFHGFRCERVFRCISGTSINISCIDPPDRYRNVAENRCIDGQHDLEVCECFDGYSGHLCEQAVRMKQSYLTTNPIFRAHMMAKSEVHEKKHWKKITEHNSREDEDEITRKLTFKYELLIAMTVIATGLSCVMIFAYYMMIRIKNNHRNRRSLMELINAYKQRDHLNALYMSPPSYSELATHLVEANENDTLTLTNENTTEDNETDGNKARITREDQEITLLSTEHRLYLHV